MGVEDSHGDGPIRGVEPLAAKIEWVKAARGANAERSAPERVCAQRARPRYAPRCASGTIRRTVAPWPG